MNVETLPARRESPASPPAPQGLPIWYELMTPEPEAVAQFYRAVLGWEIPTHGQAMPNGIEYRQIARADGGAAGGVLILTPQMSDHGARPGWMPYFHVGDVDALVAEAWQRNGQVSMPPVTMEGVGRMAMLADPQGAPFYVLDPTPPPDRPDAASDVFAPRRPGHCWWNELHTSDEPAATAFYAALFGWSAERSMPMGEKGVYRFLELGEVGIGAINPWRIPGIPVSWLPYFGVDDIDVARAAAETSGGAIVQEIHEVPSGDFIFMATDPAGAPIGITGRRGERS